MTVKCPSCGEEAKQIGSLFYCVNVDCDECWVKREEEACEK